MFNPLSGSILPVTSNHPTSYPGYYLRSPPAAGVSEGNYPWYEVGNHPALNRVKYNKVGRNRAHASPLKGLESVQ